MRIQRTMLVTTAALFAACRGESAPANTAAPTTDAQPPAAAGATAQPGPGGKIITVQLVSDEKGNYFEPSEIEAHRGDVIRYTLKVGAHNVNFLPDSNPGKTGLPPASAILQLPGQTFDVPVTFAPGTYYFQCDPHAALGMRGHLKVEGA